MITCPITGNCGNHQLFYALTRCVAESNGYKFGFNPIPEYDYYSGKEQLDFMNIDYGLEHNAKYLEMPEGVENVWNERHNEIPNSNGASFHPYQSDIWNIKDNTKLVLRCVQDARYYQHKKEDMKRWFTIKSQNEKVYQNNLNDLGIKFDDNLCIINVRGGEYKNIPSLLLKKSYWENAISHMKRIRGVNNFIVVTDDPNYAQILFPKLTVIHLSIGCDYYAILNAKNLILSNSSFAIMPTWLNNNKPFVIAPRYWARHNISDGYWASSDVWTFGWSFLGRDNKLYAF